MRIHPVLISLAVTTVFANVCLAADWPVFRGDAAQTGVAAEPLPKKLAVKWKFPTGPEKKPGSIDGAAAIVKGVVYVGSLDGFLYALDLETGKEKWRFNTGPVKAPVGFHEGSVYAGNEDGWFHCVEAATGKPVWKFEAGGEVASGVSFAGDEVLFGCVDETLYCLSRKDGSLRWKFQVAGGPVQGTPVVAAGRTYLAGCDSKLHAIDLATGNELSSVDLGGPVGAGAAVRDDTLYVGHMNGQVVSVDLKKMEVGWRFQPERSRQAFFASVAVTDKLVIAGNRDRRIYAIDRATGKEVWSFATGHRVESSPVVAGDRVIAGSLDGNLYLIDLAQGTEIQKLRLDGPVGASPAVAGGSVVIGTENGTVYCLGPASDEPIAKTEEGPPHEESSGIDFQPLVIGVILLLCVCGVLIWAVRRRFAGGNPAE